MLFENLRIKSFKLFEAPNEQSCCTIVLLKFLLVEISPLSEWSFDSNAGFPCKILAFTGPNIEYWGSDPY